jgi:diguanylate cyclase (GGDEF)-like protein
MIEKLTIDRLLYHDAISTGDSWARYLAEKVDDIAEIAQGQQPSPASISFFEQAQKVGNVFRYKIFDPAGHLRLVSDDLASAGGEALDLSEHHHAAAREIASGHPFVVVKKGKPPARPRFFSEAYMPVISNGQTVAIVEVYVDQTQKYKSHHATFTIAALSLSFLTIFAFCAPAVVLQRRTREKRRAEERVYYLAHHDPLTGLPNRTRLIEKLQYALATQGKLAVHFIDLDHFKNVNDTLGHDVGDSLLVVTAERLRALSGSNNFVARLGGDEFVLLQFGVDKKDEAEQFARQLLAVMAKSFDVNGHKIAVTTSLGIALAPLDGAVSAELLRSADLAMYAAKDAGRNCHHFFATELGVKLQARVKLEQTIRAASLSETFELHFQPIVGLPGGQLVGFEALLRLRSEDGTFIPAAVFVSVAEEMGLISSISAWVMKEACRTAVGWPEHLSLAVNLSPAQFTAAGVCDIVAAALAETGLAPQRLELEITESLLLRDNGIVTTELRRLKALGVAIVMDDFGTGYSSLGYLWRFPFDKVKIDRSFMQGLETVGQDVATIVRTIVALGKSLQIRITAEGIENARQVEFLGNLGCDQAQGRYFGWPVPATDLPVMILDDFQRRFRRSSAPQDLRTPARST